MKRRKRGETATFSLSFLDAICCGFGAIVLLLVLTKVGKPQAIEEVFEEDLDGRVLALQQELHAIRGETVVLERELKHRRRQVSEERQSIARLQGDLEKIRGEFAATKQHSEVQDILSGRLLAAQQRLSEEMKRLQAQSDQTYRRPSDAPVGGIPVDSEYIIFVIDTSGSMSEYAWDTVIEKMTQVLDAYPKVKGMQVMNDMGEYMFSTYRGKWIPDTASRRKVIVQRMRTWSPFSNSSPVEGIERAVRTFAASDKQISIYVFGDEFSGKSMDEVLDAVDKLNAPGPDGRRPVRIHAIGFPTVFSASGISQQTGIRFATLMRALCERNGGTFVALNYLR